MKITSRFITLEGSEGAGKSTNLEVLVQTMQARGLDVYVTREPGGTEMAEEIRQLILADRSEEVTPLTELLLMFAARAQHVSQVIRPRLEQGQWVVCDRFVDTSYAYQGYGRGLPLEVVNHLDQWVVADTQPGLTLYLDLPPEIGAARIAAREKDRLEMEQMAFFEAVRQGYLQRASEHDRIKLIDASRGLADVQYSVADILTEYLNHLEV